jgi:hypothetical protein
MIIKMIILLDMVQSLIEFVHSLKLLQVKAEIWAEKVHNTIFGQEIVIVPIRLV